MRAFRVRPQRRDEMAAHLDEGRRACRGQVQATEEFLARRFGSRLQPQERVGGWLASVGIVSRSRDRSGSGRKESLNISKNASREAGSNDRYDASNSAATRAPDTTAPDSNASQS